MSTWSLLLALAAASAIVLIVLHRLRPIEAEGLIRSATRLLVAVPQAIVKGEGRWGWALERRRRRDMQGFYIEDRVLPTLVVVGAGATIWVLVVRAALELEKAAFESAQADPMQAAKAALVYVVAPMLGSFALAEAFRATPFNLVKEDAKIWPLVLGGIVAISVAVGAHGWAGVQRAEASFQERADKEFVSSGIRCNLSGASSATPTGDETLDRQSQQLVTDTCSKLNRSYDFLAVQYAGLAGLLVLGEAVVGWTVLWAIALLLSALVWLIARGLHTVPLLAGFSVSVAELAREMTVKALRLSTTALRGKVPTREQLLSDSEADQEDEEDRETIPPTERPPAVGDVVRGAQAIRDNLAWRLTDSLVQPVGGVRPGVFRAEPVHLDLSANDEHQVAVLKVAPAADEDAAHLLLKEHESYDVLDRHPHLCEMIDFQVLPDARQPHLFIALRNYPHGDLHRFLFDYLGRFDAAGRRQLAFTVLDQIMDGLDYAISRGVTMNDLKPGNVFVESLRPVGDRLAFPTVRIGDWGLGKVARDRAINSSRLDWLSPMWHSPEWVLTKGRKKVTPAVDLYSVGAIGYTILTGQPPYESLLRKDLSYHAVMQGVLEGAIVLDPIPEAGNDPLAALVMRWLSFNPADRQPGANLDLGEDCDLYTLARAELAEALTSEEEL